MTISYLMVATSTALLLELAVVIGLFLAVSTLLRNVVPILTRNAARIYAVQAAFQASNTGLDPRTTFQPGQPASIALSGGDGSGEIPYIDNQVPYLDPRTPRPVHDNSDAIELSGFALLVRPDGQVLASSDPAHEQPAKAFADLLPGPEAGAVLAAMEGQAGESTEARGQERFIFATEPVWSREKHVLGVVYVQVSTPSAGTILQSFTQGWLRSGLLLLVLLTPPCALVGVLTTRGQVRRLQELTRATARFASGDYTQRIASRKHDEIILFYSDGLAEAHNPEREMFGFPRLQALLAQQGTHTSVIESLREALAGFTGEEWEQEDDMTLVMLQRMAEDARGER